MLVAEGVDEVELHLHLVRLGPGIDLLLHRLIASGDPVVPQADGKLAGGAGGADMHQWQGGGGRGHFQGGAAGDGATLGHGCFL